MFTDEKPPISKLGYEKTIYVITPTYARTSQQADLTNLAQAMMLTTAPVHWIIIEDTSKDTSTWIRYMLNRCHFPSTLLKHHTEKSAVSESAKKKPIPKRPAKGVDQRNSALQWLLKNNITRGVLYFADDDNTYDWRLFDQVSK